VVRENVTVRWLEWLVRDLPPDVLLFPNGTPAFRKHFFELCQFADLSGMGLTPLRPGGATHCFIQGMDVARLRILGRWRSIQTLDHYVQEAAAFRITHRFASSQTASVNRLLSVGRVYRRPPVLPWTAFFSRDAQTRHLQVGEAAPVTPWQVRLTNSTF
jgi:hypothetical protein